MWAVWGWFVHHTHIHTTPTPTGQHQRRRPEAVIVVGPWPCGLPRQSSASLSDRLEQAVSLSRRNMQCSSSPVFITRSELCWVWHLNLEQTANHQVLDSRCRSLYSNGSLRSSLFFSGPLSRQGSFMGKKPCGQCQGRMPFLDRPHPDPDIGT